MPKTEERTKRSEPRLASVRNIDTYAAAVSALCLIQARQNASGACASGIVTRDAVNAATIDRFEWNAARIASAKAVAERGGTARDACEALGLDPERAYLVYKLADRQGFKFRNQGRKRDDTAVTVKLVEPAAVALATCSQQHGIPTRELAARLLNIVLQQGPTFLANLLDEAA